MERTKTLLLLVLLVGLTVSAAEGQRANTAQATFTTLGGFYDFQSSGGACQYIRVNPANGHIHVVYLSSFDSTSISTSRRTFYAFSTNGGTTWNNFLDLSVPPRRSGFPSLDLMPSTEGFCTVIADHSFDGIGTCGQMFVDCPEGGGAFAEILLPSNVCLQSPQIACTADSAVVFVGTGTVDGIEGIYVRRLDTTGTWTRLTLQVAGNYVVAANPTDRVSVLLNLPGNGVLLFESTNNGRTWPATPLTVYPPQRIVGSDTFQAYVGCDLAYLNDSPLVSLHEFMSNAQAPTDSSRILFWRQSTGLVVAADKGNTPRVVPRLNRPQILHKTIGYPVIGVVQNRIVIIYQAFMPETSMAGFNYSDLFLVRSNDNGFSWYSPENITQTPALDERYPGISKTNWPSAPIFVHVVWQEDPEPGSTAGGDNAPLSRASQKYSRIQVIPASVDPNPPAPDHFALEQNYPNPFNPVTTIRYTLPAGTRGRTFLRVYDILGREIATLVNEEKLPGHYDVTWDAGTVPSGVYFYRLTANGNTRISKAMVLK